MCDACDVTANADATRSRVDILERRWRTDDGDMAMQNWGSCKCESNLRKKEVNQAESISDKKQMVTKGKGNFGSEHSISTSAQAWDPTARVTFAVVLSGSWGLPSRCVSSP
jgi:hypothetical protein